MKPFKIKAWAVIQSPIKRKGVDIFLDYVEAELFADSWSNREVIPVTITERGKTEWCRWTYDDTTDSWDTECDEKFVFTEGGPKESEFGFCPFNGCGKKIKVMKGR